ncbi:MAG: hydrolase [Candidatus Eisenbacteria bacterium]|nr:hydrolase [Candidatus Eisenbacteria bacterium]
MLKTETTVLVIIDVQGKLAHLMHRKEELFENLQKIIKGARILGIPILWLEQNPEGLGPTIPELAALLDDVGPISKFSFSCCGDDRFVTALNSLNRKQVLLAGIETHICVYQTATDLVASGYEVQIVSDAVSSRTKENRKIGLERIKEIGAGLTGTETALFELLRTAKAEKFKEIAKIVK